jgi:hypothetical protein
MVYLHNHTLILTRFPIDDPRILIWQTLLVRVIAVFTGVISAFIVNTVISATAPLAVYKMAMFFTERTVWRVQKHRMDPLHEKVQLNFQRTNEQIQLAPSIYQDATSWLFSEDTRDEIQLIKRRSKVIFRFLTFRSFLELFVESSEKYICDVNDAELRSNVELLIEMSKRNARGNSLRGLSLQEELEILENMPASLNIPKSIFKSILIDLNSNVVQYRDSDHIVPFIGRV